MNFDLQNAIQILERTPQTLKSMLTGLSDGWIRATEGAETWSPYDVLGHLIHGERTDWIARLDIILSDKAERKFVSFDRFAQFEESKGKSLDQLLAEFAELRQKNVAILRSRNIKPSDYTRTAIHPALGDVTLGNLISTWVVHDLDHLYQISRVMSLQYRDNVGPWVAYLWILNPGQKSNS